jgi:hypothetical protein
MSRNRYFWLIQYLKASRPSRSLTSERQPSVASPRPRRRTRSTSVKTPPKWLWHFRIVRLAPPPSPPDRDPPGASLPAAAPPTCPDCPSVLSPWLFLAIGFVLGIGAAQAPRLLLSKRLKMAPAESATGIYNNNPTSDTLR